MTGIELRAATAADSAMLLDWRNDPLTRAMSFTSDPIDRETHEAWFARTLVNSDRTLLVAEADGAPVATVRLDRDNGETLLHWTVAPDARGKGYGVAAVTAAVKQCGGPVVAKIKRENAASRRIAERAGLALADLEPDGTEVWRA